MSSINFRVFHRYGFVQGTCHKTGRHSSPHVQKHVQRMTNWQRNQWMRAGGNPLVVDKYVKMQRSDA